MNLSIIVSIAHWAMAWMSWIIHLKLNRQCLLVSVQRQAVFAWTRLLLQRIQYREKVYILWKIFISKNSIIYTHSLVLTTQNLCSTQHDPLVHGLCIALQCLHRFTFSPWMQNHRMSDVDNESREAPRRSTNAPKTLDSFSYIITSLFIQLDFLVSMLKWWWSIIAHHLIFA